MMHLAVADRLSTQGIAEAVLLQDTERPLYMQPEGLSQDAPQG